MTTHVHTVGGKRVVSVVGESLKSGQREDVIVNLLVQLVPQEPLVEVTVQATLDRLGPVFRQVVTNLSISVVEGLEVENHVVERTSHDTATTGTVGNSSVVTVHNGGVVTIATKRAVTLVEDGTVLKTVLPVQGPVHVRDTKLRRPAASMHGLLEKPKMVSVPGEEVAVEVRNLHISNVEVRKVRVERLTCRDIRDNGGLVHHALDRLDVLPTVVLGEGAPFPTHSSGRVGTCLLPRVVLRDLVRSSLLKGIDGEGGWHRPRGWRGRSRCVKERRHPGYERGE